MAINKFQRSRLTFDLSAIVAHIGVPSSYLNIVFSEAYRPMEIKFHMTTPYDWLAKICTNCYGHMTKMATKPIYGKNYLNSVIMSSLEPKSQWPWDLLCSIEDVVPTRFAQMMNLG